MGEDSIVAKLKKFLTDHDPVTEECHVVYLLVEIRKLMDRIGCNDSKYKILRFYCDWMLHTEKSRQLDVIAPLVQGIEDSILQGHSFPDGQFLPLGNSPIQFIYKEELRISMNNLFLEQNFPVNIFNKDEWEKFVFLLIRVLIDQPIVLNGNRIKSLCFREVIQAANLEVKFQNGKEHNFLNVF